jgi:formate dehydrogenase subunit gamma
MVTGIFLYFPPLSDLARDSWSRLVHRIGALIFVLIPLVYLLTNWKASWRSVKEALTWTWEDVEWVVAAPRYYFLGDESAMPPQRHMNSGQKLWYLIVLVAGTVFVITGAMMWFFKDILPSAFFQWSVFAHDVFFIVVISMFFVHIYLSVLHPLMRQHGGAFSSMVDGTITAEYARTHHGKWYEEQIAKRKKAQ